MSGSDSTGILQGCFRPQLAEVPARTPLLGRILSSSGISLDQVLVTLFQGPASYTGEDMVEISCHGSPVVTRAILTTLLDGGARLATPGEFTMRAFLAGKIDLAQAEAVRDLIASRTLFQAQIAAQQLMGRLSRQLAPLRESLIRIVSHLETTLEFVEDVVEPASRQELLVDMVEVEQELARLEAGFSTGRLLEEGATIVIAGRPNVGKSSVFNRLVSQERAIVTAHPGTTRDALAETIDLGGIPTRLVDTAGIRETSEWIEGLGVEKSKQFIGSSQIVLFVVDGSLVFSAEDYEVWRLIGGIPYVLVINKGDLPGILRVPDEVWGGAVKRVRISALREEGMVELRSVLVSAIVPGAALELESVLVTNERQRLCLQDARACLKGAIGSYAGGLSEEFPAYDLRKALQKLGEVTGETHVQDILREIFSTFCIGK